jgi:thioredoxin-related protein
MQTCAAIALAVLAAHAQARIPEVYGPVVVTAPFSFSEREFDLTDAVDKARASGKPLFIYLGAEDCAPCKQFSAFLKDNHAELAQMFRAVVLVDIRTWLKGPKISFAVGQTRFSSDEFKIQVGDQSRSLSYPSFWFLDANLKPIRILPPGSANYMSVTRLRELIRMPEGREQPMR